MSDGTGAITDINRYDEWGNPQTRSVPGRARARRRSGRLPAGELMIRQAPGRGS